MASEVDEGYFNDLSRQPQKSNSESASPLEQNGSISTAGTYDQSELPKTKRIACVICRKRKLKCDGNRPKCATCARLGHNCAYDEVRKKSGPKRGYVKELEARLAQVEAQVRSKTGKKAHRDGPERRPDIPEAEVMEDTSFSVAQCVPQTTSPPVMDDPYTTMKAGNSPAYGTASNMVPEAMTVNDFAPEMNFNLDDNFSWEMIGLGLEEPLPQQEAVDELTSVYFEKIHPSLPMLHKFRYYSSMSLSPHARPPVCLRYAMWTMAASITDKYMHHADIFYRRSRRYLELDEMKGVGEGFVSLARAQTWILLSAHEFKMMYFPRAWMSVGRAGRMVTMMGLHRLDGIGMDVKQCLPPPKDWTEREERRRTFWMGYCVDRYASMGTGWPMSIDERDIMTTLPASEEAYESDTPQTTSFMGDSLSTSQIQSLSPFAGVCYVTHFFGLNLTHLHRPEPDDDETSPQGKFWKRHTRMDNMLSNTCLALPQHLRLPQGIRNPNVTFLNYSIHTSTICLHQAAIFKAEKNNLPNTLIQNSRARCLLAAAEIASTMRLTSHLDISGMNPFIAFCLYVAARVLVQYLKSSPHDSETRSSLEFLLTALTALRRLNPLSESFLIQLNLDMQGSGLDILLHNPDFSSIVKDKVRPQNKQGGAMMPSEAASSPSSGLQNINFCTVSKPQCSGVENSDSPSLQSDSGRPGPYAFNSMELNARYSHTLHPYFPEDHQGPYSLEGTVLGGAEGASGPHQPWSGPTGTLQNHDNMPVGMNPVLNTNINSNVYDTTMSDRSGPSRNNSTGFSPQSSASVYQPSSNTSYSPPTVQNEYALTSKSPTQQQANSIPTTLDDAFRVPPGWEMGSGTGSTPGFAGMTPGGDWDKMMQSMNWDSTDMTPR